MALSPTRQKRNNLTISVDESKISHPVFPQAEIRHTLNHVNCPACERSRNEALSVITPEMDFTEAARVWLDFCTLSASPGTNAGRYIEETTETSYRQYCESLNLFFGGMRLGAIHFGNLREYQRARVGGLAPFIRRRRPHEEPGPCPASPKKTNQELSVLRRIMIRGGCWTSELDQFYRPLLEEELDAMRALEPDEQALWLNTAAQKERWQLVHWYSVLGIGTTMSTNEMRWLRVGDVNLFHRTIAVAGKGVKCKGRRRVIALLTAEELWAAEQLLVRARECGSVAPQHYVMPFRIKRYGWVPTKPMSTSGIKREWQEVREATGLTWFRQYDLRHTGATRLAEAGWRPAQIESRMGHLTAKMREHYTHIGEAAQRREHERVSALQFAPRAVERRVLYTGTDRRVVS